MKRLLQEPFPVSARNRVYPHTHHSVCTPSDAIRSHERRPDAEDVYTLKKANQRIHTQRFVRTLLCVQQRSYALYNRRSLARDGAGLRRGQSDALTCTPPTRGAVAGTGGLADEVAQARKGFCRILFVLGWKNPLQKIFPRAPLRQRVACCTRAPIVRA